MAGAMSRMAKRELMASIQDRYQESSKKDKGRILDEFTAVTGHHRKHGIRLLGKSGDAGGLLAGVTVRRNLRRGHTGGTDPGVGSIGPYLRQASESGAALPGGVHETPRNLDLDAEVRERLLSASAATLDRLLKPVHATVASRRKRPVI